MTDTERTTKGFPTGAVLSVVTGILVSETRMAGVYEVLSWMAGESVFTHQIPRISGEARPLILAMHPHLATTIEEAQQVDPDNVRTWIATWKARYGDEIAVPLMTIAEHERIDPMAELAEKVHPDRIIAVSTDAVD